LKFNGASRQCDFWPNFKVITIIFSSPQTMAALVSLKRPNASQANGTMADDAEAFIRKRIKLSDLPITSSQRKDIDGLLQTFKKKGDFDKLRKQIFSEFTSSVRANMVFSHVTFTDFV
jgi:hypothetical protein